MKNVVYNVHIISFNIVLISINTLFIFLGGKNWKGAGGNDVMRYPSGNLALLCRVIPLILPK